MKMLSTYWVCCIYSNAHLKTFTVEANTMDSDQTAFDKQSTLADEKAGKNCCEWW